MEEIATTQKEERKCRDCGVVLGPGREDRQYCDSACKTNFNNRRRREQQKGEETSAEQQLPELSVPDYITRIQDILLNNRTILEGLCDEERVEILMNVTTSFRRKLTTHSGRN